MDSVNQFLDTLLEDFVAWANGIEACRSVILFGSMAREEKRGDKYSDRDIYVFVTDPDSDQYLNWMREYAPLWMVIKELKTLWLIVYKGGHSVHLSIDPLEDLLALVKKGELHSDMRGGYKILLDKDDLAAKLPEVTKSEPETPSEKDFLDCVQNFFYGTTLIAKQIKRGNLWKVQWANSIEHRFMLNMLEWHSQVFKNANTWNRGEFMKDWLDDEIWERLPEIFGGFDVEGSWRALSSSMELFHKLAHEIADELDFSLPEEVLEEIIDYVQALRSEKDEN